MDRLIEAMPEIIKNIPEAKLLIVGEFYENENDYTSLVKKLELDSKVTIINQFVSNEEV